MQIYKFKLKYKGKIIVKFYLEDKIAKKYKKNLNQKLK